MNTVRFSFTRIRLIAANTVRESIRQKLVLLMMVFAVGMLATSQLFRDFSFGTTELKFIADFGFGTITLFGSILAVVISVQTFFNEIENRTALTLLAKPVLRSEFMLGKFFGVFAILMVFVLVVTSSLILVLYWRERGIAAGEGVSPFGGGSVLYGAVALFSVLQLLKFGLVSGIALLIGSYSNTNLFTMIMTFCVIVIGHLQYLALDAWRHLDSLVARVAAGFISFLFPNFQLFNLGDRIASGGSWSWSVLGSVGLYALIYLAVVLALGVFSMSRREI